MVRKIHAFLLSLDSCKLLLALLTSGKGLHMYMYIFTGIAQTDSRKAAFIQPCQPSCLEELSQVVKESHCQTPGQKERTN